MDFSKFWKFRFAADGLAAERGETIAEDVSDSDLLTETDQDVRGMERKIPA